MANSPTYSSGLGLELHARTKIVSDWSLISNLALRIGNDIFEVANDGSHYFNGVKNVELPLMLAGQYLVTKGEDIISTFEEDGSSQEVAQQLYTIHLNNDDEILMSVFRSMITSISLQMNWKALTVCLVLLVSMVLSDVTVPFSQTQIKWVWIGK